MKHAGKRHLIAAIALLGLIGSAYALDDPPIKEGYWSVHQVTVDQPGNKTIDGKYFICRNHAYDAYVETLKNVPGCVSDTSIHSETNATYTPLFMGHASEKMTMDFAYVGSCPAGIQPGDRVDQTGAVRHLWRH